LTQLRLPQFLAVL